MPGTSDRFRLVPTALAAAMLSLGASLVRAGPSGGEVVGGEGNIQYPDDQTTQVNQHSDKMVIDWQSFNLSPEEAVNFFQPSSDALVLNQILDGDLSVIRGQINANGHVILANPNGIYFGDTAQLSVGSLVASGHHLSSEDFLDGNLNFERVDGTSGQVINRGTINAATGGSVTLLGNRVENTGQIMAHAGRINLVVGERIALDFDGDGLMRFSVDEALLSNADGHTNAIFNQGELQANGGTIALEGRVAQDIFSQVVNNEGVIEAGRIDNSGGEIRLVGRGGSASSVVNTGQIDASAQDATSDGGKITLHAEDSTLLVKDDSLIRADSESRQGGQVHLLGEQIALTGNTRVDASGGSGGGEILIGGDLQGQNADIPNAQKVIVTSQVNLHADSLNDGDGGRIITWADDWIRFSGNLSARGGAEGGDGGFAEVSGKNNLAYSGWADLSAPHGQTGTLLLDPETINIVAGTGAEDSELTDDNQVLFDDGSGDFEIGADTISNQTADVLLQATQDILQNSNAAINITNPNTGITLQAGRHIDLQAGITTSDGHIILEADSSGYSAGTGTITVAGAGLNSTGGNITLSGANLDITEAVNAGAGEISMSATNDMADSILLGADVTNSGAQTYSGAVTLDGERTLAGSDLTFLDALKGDGTNDLNISGNLELNGSTTEIGTLDVNGNLDLQDTGNIADTDSLEVSGTSSLGANITTTGDQTYTGQVTLTGTGALRTLTADASQLITMTGGVVGGDNSLTINNANWDLGAEASGLETLIVDGTASLSGNVSSTGTQEYQDTVTLAGGDIVQELTGSTVMFASDVLATTDSEEGLLVTGDAEFGGHVGTPSTSLKSLEVTGTSSLGGDITTSGNQTYRSGVTLAATGLTLTGSSLTFEDSLSGAGHDLNLVGDTTFEGAVDNMGALGITGDFILGNLGSITDTASLEVSGTSSLGANITTTSTQTYTGAVTLTENVTLAANDGTTDQLITFEDTLNSVATEGNTLTLNANAQFDDAVGGGADGELGSLSVSGTSSLGGNITTTGTQTYTGAVTLTENVTLAANDGTTDQLITFENTVNSAASEGNTLTLDANAQFDDAVGGGADSELGSLDVFGTATVDGDITTTGSQTYQNLVLNADLDANDLTVNSTADLGGNVTTTGDQTYTGQVTLTGTGALRTLTAEAGQLITMTGGVVGGDNSLTISDANWSLGADASGLDTLVVDGTASLSDDVTTSGNQTYNGVVSLFGERTLDGSLVRFNDAVTGDNTNGLTINGDLSLQGALTDVADLEVTGSSSLAADVTTTGTQTYTGAVTLTGNRELDGTTLTFSDTVTGDGTNSLNIHGDLELQGATSNIGALDVTGDLGLHSTASIADTAGLSVTGTATIDGNVTTTGSQTYQDLLLDADLSAAELTVNGTASLGGDIITENNQSYNGAVTLTDNVILTSTNNGNIAFASSVTGDGNDLDLDASSGQVEFEDITGVRDLGITAGQIELSQNISTTGTQTYTGAVTLTDSIALNTTDGDILFASTVNGSGAGGQSLTLAIGNGTATFEDNVGGNVALGALDITGNLDLQAAIVDAASLEVSGTADLGGNVTTTDNQTYSGAITLNGERTLAGNTLTFSSIVTGDGTNGLTIAGDLDLQDVLSNLAAFEVTGTSLLGADVTTTGNQSYNGAVTLAGNVALASTNNGNIAFASSVTGDGNDLDLDAGNGQVEFGTITGVQNLGITAGQIELSQNISTTGTQTYTGAVTLTDSITLTADNSGDLQLITFEDAVDSEANQGFSLTLNSNAQFNGAVGGGTNGELGSLDVSGTTDVGGDITTTGDQTHNGAVTLTGEHTLTGSNLIFESTLNGNDNDLNLVGDTTFEGAVTDLGALDVDGHLTLENTARIDSTESLTVTGGADLSGNVTTTDNQTYTGAVTLTDSVTLATTDSNILFSSPVNGSGAGGQSLTLTMGNGTATFEGSVGDNVTLGALDITGNLDLQAAIADSASLAVSGTADLGGDVTTTGSQTYSGAVTLTDTVTLTSDSDITFASTLDGTHDLTLNADTTTFSGVVGGNTALGDIAVDGDLDLQADITDAANLTVSGTADLGGDVTTTDNQSYNDAVTLTGNVALTSTNNGNIAFASSVTGDGNDLDLDAGNGQVEFGTITGVQNLGIAAGQIELSQNISTSGTQTYTGAVTLTDSITLTANNGGDLQLITFAETVNSAATEENTLTLDANAQFDDAVGSGVDGELGSLTVSGTAEVGGDITTSGDQTYTGAVNLAGERTLTGSLIDFSDTVTGDNTNGLTIAGDLNLQGALTNVTDLEVTGTSLLAADVTTTGTQTYTGAVTLNGERALTGSRVTFSDALTGDGTNGLNINGNLELNGATTEIGVLDVDGNLDLQDTGNIANTASLNVTGTATIDGAVTTTGTQTYQDLILGADLSAAELTVNGTADLGGNVTTADNQTYSGQVTLTDSITLTTTNSAVLFASTVNGSGAGGQSLTLTMGNGTATFEGSVGDNVALGALDITGNLDLQAAIADAASLSVSGTADLATDVTTTGNQTYTGQVTLTDDVELTSTNSDITLNGDVEGNSNSLTLNADNGTLVFQALSNLDNLILDADSFDLHETITTAGNQSYTGAVTLTDSITLTTTNGGDILFSGSVDGASEGNQSLTLDTGSGDIDISAATIGGTTKLGNLTIEEAQDSDFGAINLTGTFRQEEGYGTTTLSGAIDAASINLKVNRLTLDEINLEASNNITLIVDELLTVGLGGNTTLTATEVFLSPFTDDKTVQICRDITCDDNSFDTIYDLGDLSITADTIRFGNDGHQGVITLEGINFDYELQVENDADIIVTGDLDGTSGGALVLNPGVGNDTLLQGGQVHTEGHQTYNSNVLLSGDFSLLSEAGTIAINGDLSSAISGNLTLNTNSDNTGGIGDIDFTGSITDLNDLTIVEAQNVDLGGTVNINGDFDLQNAAGTLTLVDGLSLTAASIGLNADTIRSTGTADINLSTLNHGDIDLITNELTLGGDLDLNAGSGNITLAPQNINADLGLCSGTSCPGGGHSHDALFDIGTGFSFNTDSNFQVGQADQTGDITLYGFTADYDLTLANTGAGGITLSGAYNSDYDLSLSSGEGGINIEDTISLQGGNLELTADDGNGDIELGANIQTGAGNQTYNGAVTLTDSVALTTTGGDILFESTVDGNQALTINAGSGDVDFADVVGGNTPLASLDVTAANIDFTDLTTNGNLRLTAANNLEFQAGTTLEAGGQLRLAVNQAGSSNFTLDLSGLNLNSNNSLLQGSGNDRLQGHNNLSNDWVLSGSNSARINNSNLTGGAGFNGFSRLQAGDEGDTFEATGTYAGTVTGGTGNDTFLRTGNGQFGGQINGGGGSNTYDVSGTTNPVTLTWGQGFTNIQSLVGNGDTLRGSATQATDWDLTGTSAGELSAGGNNATFEGFTRLISGTGGRNTFESNGQYNGTIELRGNDNRWLFTAGQRLTRGQVEGNGTLFIPQRADGSAGTVRLSTGDLYLPALNTYTGNLFIGGTVTPGTLPLNGNSNASVNVNRLSVDRAVETGGNLVLLASEVDLTGAPLTSGGQISFVTVGSFCDICANLTGSGNLRVREETQVQAQSGQVIAAGGIAQSENLVLNFGGGDFELAVSQEQRETSQPSELSNARGVDLRPTTEAFIDRLGLELVSVAVSFANPAASVLGVQAVEVIDLSLFEEDLTLFGQMGEGVALAFSQCEEVEGCTPDVTDEELTASINELQERIDQLESELDATDDPTRREQLETLLADFQSQQAEFSAYREDLQAFTGFEELLDEELDTGDEIDMEAVDRELEVIETIYTRVRFLENLQYNSERRAQFAESTGLDLSEERLNAIIDSTLESAARAEARLERLLDGD